MARMSDEAYELKREIREQKVVANNARNRRGMAGKGGKVRLSSDRLTQKQWEAKNGDCKSYRMNDPMTWEQFEELPDDLKVCYIKAIRNKYKVPDIILATCMSVRLDVFSQKMTELKLALNDKAAGWYESEQRKEFAEWWHKMKPVTRGGSLRVEGNVEEDLKNLLETVKGRNVRMQISWEIMEE